jgi:hypothetical protein
LAFIGVTPLTPAQLSVSPTLIENRAYPGGIVTFTFNVGNRGENTLRCELDITAMVVLEGGMPVSVEEAPRCCKDWIKLNPEAFDLPPKTGKRIVCRARPPRQTAGGYYAMIRCTGLPDQPDQDEDGRRGGVSATVDLGFRSLIPVLLTVPSGNVQALIEAGVPFFDTAEGGKGYAMHLPVRNRGNIHTRMAGTVEIKSHAGQLVERYDLEAGQGFILPGHERLFTSRSRVNLADGAYVAKICLNAAKRGQPMEKAFPFAVRSGVPEVQEITEDLLAELKKQSAGFIVSPSELQVRLRPGGRRIQAIELSNLTRETLVVKTRLMEWYRRPDSVDLVLDDVPRHKRSGRPFIRIQQPEIELNPLCRRRVPITFVLPEGAEGEQYCALTLDRKDIQLNASPESLARRSVLLCVYAEGTGLSGADISGFETVRDPNGKIIFTVNFNNTGNIGISPDASIVLKNEDGGTVGKCRPSVTCPVVQAGCDGRIIMAWTEVLNPGKYTAELNMKYDRNKPALVNRTELVIPEGMTSGPP